MVPCEARWVPGIKGKKDRLLDPQGFVVLYIKKDGARNFYKCSEHAEGCGVRVSTEWEKNMIVRHNGKLTTHDNKLMEREVKEEVEAAVNEAVTNHTLNSKAVHQSYCVKSVELTVGEKEEIRLGLYLRAWRPNKFFLSREEIRDLGRDRSEIGEKIRATLNFIHLC